MGHQTLAQLRRKIARCQYSHPVPLVRAHGQNSGWSRSPLRRGVFSSATSAAAVARRDAPRRPPLGTRPPPGTRRRRPPCGRCRDRQRDPAPVAARRRGAGGGGTQPRPPRVLAASRRSFCSPVPPLTCRPAGLQLGSSPTGSPRRARLEDVHWSLAGARDGGGRPHGLRCHLRLCAALW